MCSVEINRLWKTVLATRNAEGCFKEVSGQKKEVGRAGAVVEVLLWTGMPLNHCQLIFQGTRVKYFLKNVLCLLSC